MGDLGGLPGLHEKFVARNYFQRAVDAMTEWNSSMAETDGEFTREMEAAFGRAAERREAGLALLRQRLREAKSLAESESEIGNDS